MRTASRMEVVKSWTNVNKTCLFKTTITSWFRACMASAALQKEIVSFAMYHILTVVTSSKQQSVASLKTGFLKLI